MLGMKKRTPAGHAAVGIILTATLLFAGGCSTNTQNRTTGSTVSEQTSELVSEQAAEQNSDKTANMYRQKRMRYKIRCCIWTEIRYHRKNMR